MIVSHDTITIWFTGVCGYFERAGKHLAAPEWFGGMITVSTSTTGTRQHHSRELRQRNRQRLRRNDTDTELRLSWYSCTHFLCEQPHPLLSEIFVA